MSSTPPLMVVTRPIVTTAAHGPAPAPAGFHTIVRGSWTMGKTTRPPEVADTAALAISDKPLQVLSPHDTGRASAELLSGGDTPMVAVYHAADGPHKHLTAIHTVLQGTGVQHAREGATTTWSSVHGVGDLANFSSRHRPFQPVSGGVQLLDGGRLSLLVHGDAAIAPRLEYANGRGPGRITGDFELVPKSQTAIFDRQWEPSAETQALTSWMDRQRRAAG